MNKSYRKSGSGTYFVIFIILLAALFLYIRYHHRTLQPVKGFPLLADKPKPVEIIFRGCPPEGDGGDPELNKLKNRVDEGNYLPVDFDILETLPWPHDIEKKKRMLWSTDDAEEINQYEGTPVMVEGYLAGVREEGPESPNCREKDHDNRDYHMWLTKTAGYDRTNSIVVETTPRVRQKHFSWKVRFLKELSKRHEQFRISGWVMLDPEHPDQVGKTRGTIWEIHPVMKIEVKMPLGWKSLDDMVPPNEHGKTNDENIDGD